MLVKSSLLTVFAIEAAPLFDFDSNRLASREITGLGPIMSA
jgi:hypothetical protein